MAKEIERKFLVTSLKFREEAIESYKIVQGYLSKEPERTVRVRIAKGRGSLTIKGRIESDGVSRFEWERELEIEEAKELLKLTIGKSVVKWRYIVPIEGSSLKFEVDLFEGDHRGLIVAEIELEDPLQQFESPSWLGREVTGEAKYYNSNL